MNQTPILEGTQVGPYFINKLLGQGGMGQVFSAVDTRLNRQVALKFLMYADPDSEQRFLREARHQANLDHELICKVYEVGELEGRSFIALQLIEGETLAEAAGKMTREEVITVIRDVALGIHEAHSQSLIHRDLKPGNIMVSRSQAGEWKPIIMDFGLVRNIDAPGMTMTGMVLGSPAYMSPEQALGDISLLDRRSDIFSLGVTLYELVVGTLPYEAVSSTEILIQVVEEEPRHIRSIDKNIPENLATIIMKCIEKEPGGRYENALLLAEDLTAFLTGNKILAKKVPFHVLLKRRILKNKALSLAIFLACLIGIAFVVNTYRSRQQALLAQAFGQEVEMIERLCLQSYLLPLHDLGPDYEIVEERMVSISERMADFGRSGKALGNNALGRAYQSMGNYEQAQFHLQKAWDGGHQTAETAFYLGKAFGEIYLQKLNALSLRKKGEAFENEKLLLDEKYKTPSLKYLRLGFGAENEPEAYIGGLIAFYEGDHKRALARVAEVVTMGPTLYRAKKLEAIIYQNQGFEFDLGGETEKAKTHYRKAIAAYLEAINIARNEPSLYQGLSYCYDKLVIIDMSGTEDIEDQFRNAIYYAEQGLIATPEDAELNYLLASIYTQRCNHYQREQKDVGDACEKAAFYGKRATELNPNDLFGLRQMAVFYLGKGYREGQAGLNHVPTLKEGLSYAEKALKIAPEARVARNIYATMSLCVAQALMLHRQEPGVYLDQAIETYEQLLKSYPNSKTIKMNLITCYLQQFQYQHLQGVEEELKRVTALGQEFYEQNRNAYFGVATWIRVLLVTAANEMLLGKDPSGYFQEIETYISQAREMKPTNYENEHLSANLSLQKAQWYARKAEILAAIASHQKADEVQKDPAISRGLIEAYFALMRWELRQGQLQSKTKNEVAQWLKTLPDGNSDLIAAYRIYLLKDQHKRLGHAAHDSIAEARYMLNKARKEAPDRGDLSLMQADIYYLEFLSGWGGESLESALRKVDRALGFNPKLAAGWYARWQILKASKGDAAEIEKSLSLAKRYAPHHYAD